MKTLKDKAKGFILSLFNKVKNNEVVTPSSTPANEP